MAAIPDTYLAFQQQSAVAFWTELQDSTPAYINRGAHQYASVRLQTHCLKAKRLFANELSWWQILPFNWLVKEATRITLHRCSSHSGWCFLFIMCGSVCLEVWHTSGDWSHVTPCSKLLIVKVQLQGYATHWVCVCYFAFSVPLSVVPTFSLLPPLMF